MGDREPVILCVDDDPDVLEAVRVMLESGGYKMVEAHSAEEALRIFRETRPDLIMVDLMMEEVDAGISFVKEVKAIGNAIPIFMVSSVGDSLALSIDATDLGLAGVLQKPIDRETLLGLVKMKVGKESDEASKRPSD